MGIFKQVEIKNKIIAFLPRPRFKKTSSTKNLWNYFKHHFKEIKIRVKKECLNNMKNINFHICYTLHDRNSNKGINWSLVIQK